MVGWGEGGSRCGGDEKRRDGGNDGGIEGNGEERRRGKGEE